MALFKELLVADLSGKVGANVFSHNRGGKYVRVLSIPTNPNTPQQQLVRSAFAGLSTRWFNILNATQRNSWTIYAQNVPVTNRIGERVNLSGLAMYIRCNTAKFAQGIPITDDGPTDFTDSVFLPQPPANATEAGQTIDFAFAVSPLSAPWANEAGSFLLIYVSAPQNASVRFFTGPYRFAGAQEGDPAPPSSPFTVGAPFPFVAGQKLFWRQVIAQLDGRISITPRGEIIAVA